MKQLFYSDHKRRRRYHHRTSGSWRSWGPGFMPYLGLSKFWEGRRDHYAPRTLRRRKLRRLLYLLLIAAVGWFVWEAFRTLDLF